MAPAFRKRTLLLETLLPTVLVVGFGSLVSAHLLGMIFERTHSEGSEGRVSRLTAKLADQLTRTGASGHRELDHALEAAAAASGKRIFIALPNGQLVFSSGQLPEDATASDGRLVSAGQAFRRYSFDLAAASGCLKCHPESASLGKLIIDSPLEAADREVAEQKSTNLIAGGILAIVLSLSLALTQYVLLYRPLRSINQAIARIRSGDFSARADLTRPDEIGDLVQALNDMAQALAEAKSEIDRTHRAELAQSAKLASLGELTSTIAHEIKNPLAGIIGALRVLESGARRDDPNKEVLAKIVAQAERLSKTAVELLDFARPLRPSIEPTDVRDLLDRTLFFVERQAAEQHVEIRRRYVADVPPASVDADLIRQALLNLIINGLQAMPKGGVLEARVESGPGASIDVVISDQGPGIASENLEKIFSPFFSTKPKGTGLGLHIARQLVETQRGEIKVSTQLGQGTSFTVRLPAGTHT